MQPLTEHEIRIRVETSFIPDQSTPDDNQYVFAYTVSITNLGRIPVQLMRRHWIITDANNNVREVRGEGVVGEQPHLDPGQTFRYTSGAILETPVGCMEGSYTMRCDDGEEFDAPIAAFNLSTPSILN